jgi:hypothetical protein
VRRRDRGLVPVVGKALEIAVLVLLTALLATALFGSALPAYRTAAGAELGDRTLAAAAERVERAVPARPADDVRRDLRVDLPDRIRGSTYVIRGRGQSLVLDHPTAGVGDTARLALPSDVRVTGAWSSGSTAVVRVRGDAEALRVTLVEGGWSS